MFLMTALWPCVGRPALTEGVVGSACSRGLGWFSCAAQLQTNADCRVCRVCRPLNGGFACQVAVGGRTHGLCVPLHCSAADAS